MDQYPGNSKMPPKVEVPEEKKIDQVVQGVVVRRKTPISKRARDLFLGGDSPKTIWQRVLISTVVPQVQDLLANMGREALEQAVYGNSQRTKGYTGRGSSPNGIVNYSGMSIGGGRQQIQGPQISPRGREMHDFGEIELASRAEATMILDRMFELLERYEAVTVKDLYSLVGLTSEYTDNKYGWIPGQLTGAGVVHTRRGSYKLNLPRPEVLK